MSDLLEARVPPNDMRYPVNWRKRDGGLYAFLRAHSATTEQLARFFPGRTVAARRKKAAKWLCRQRKRGRVRVVGVVQRRDTGRPEVVYGRRCKLSQVEHEVRITDLALHYHPHPFTRDAKIGTTTADGLLTIDGRPCWVEIDNTENMDRKQMTAKWKRYPRDLGGFILVVCLTDGRMQRLRTWEGSELVKDVALYTTFERLRGGQPWVDGFGNTVVI